MWVAWLIFWWIGAFISFPLAWLRFIDSKRSKIIKIGLIILGTILSWINIICELLLINHELKEEEKKYDN